MRCLWHCLWPYRVLNTCITPRAGILFCALLALIGCNPKQPSGPLFNVPSLIGQKMPAVEKQLGAATETQDSGDSARKTWRKEGHVLTAEYLKRNGRITSWTLAPEDSGNTIKEEAKADFLKLAQLQESDARYSIDWVEDSEQVLRFSGVRVTPSPVTHKVTLRVTGSQSLVGVQYTVTGNNGENPTETFLTMPPWDLQLSATTGATIKILARPFQAGRTPSPIIPKTSVQIVVDGQVAQEKTSEGGAVEIAVEL
jgi:hypothetical protein